MSIRNTVKKILAGAFALAMLTACGAENTTHTHSATGEWDRNATEHWHVCECGEKLDVEAHALDDMLVCSVCNSEIWDLGDGMYDVHTYDESGEMLRSTSYDAEGNVITESRYVREYDEGGNQLSGQYFENDRLLQADEFTVTEDGINYLHKGTSYQEDGSYFVNEYDEVGNVTAVYSYDTDGTLTFEGHCEYAYTEDGMCYEAKTTDCDYLNGTKFVCEYNEHGDLITRIKYDLDDHVEYEESYEREYGDEGQMLWEKTYRDGVLTYEIVGYASSSDEFGSWRYPETTIDYYEDGTKLVSKYNENGDLATETYYNADETVDRELTYAYETDNEGNWSSIKVYEGEWLVRDTKYALSEDGWSYQSKVTEYHEDGSKTVSEYDENEELLTETKYDADGNEIS